MAKILIVEDEVAMAKALEIKLKSDGFETDVAHNGEEALDKILNTGGFDLVLLDLVMPKVDGFTVLEKLGEKESDVPPIIVSSNLSQNEEFQRAKDLGATDFYVKSNTPLARIVELINENLRK